MACSKILYQLRPLVPWICSSLAIGYAAYLHWRLGKLKAQAAERKTKINEEPDKMERRIEVNIDTIDRSKSTCFASFVLPIFFFFRFLRFFDKVSSLCLLCYQFHCRLASQFCSSLNKLLPLIDWLMLVFVLSFYCSFYCLECISSQSIWKWWRW